VNDNPCLEFSAPLLEGLLSNLVENALRLAVDGAFPPPASGSRSAKAAEAVAQIESAEDRFDQIYPLER